MFIPDPRWEEPNLLIPGKKPTGPVVIDWSHPLAPFIDHLWLYTVRPGGFNESGFTNRPVDPLLFDHVGGQHLHGYLLNGTDVISVEACANGIGGGYDGNDSDYGQSFITRVNYPTPLHANDGGFLVVCYVRDAGKKTVLIGQANGALSPINQYGCALGFDSGTAVAWRSFNNATHKAEIGISAGYNALACTFEGTSVAIAVNGAISTGTCGASGNTYDFSVGMAGHSYNSAAGRARLDGVVLMACQMRSGVPLGLLSDVTKNPYQFLIPA